MKKLVPTIAVIVTISIIFTACSGTLPEQKDIDSLPVLTIELTDIKDVVVVQSSRTTYPRLLHLLEPADWGGEELDKSADLVIIGEFIDDTRFEQGAQRPRNPNNPDEIFEGVSTMAYNRMEIIEVLQGNASVGDIITVAQRYSFENTDEHGEFFSRDGLTPMHKGDRWLYFLIYNEDNNYYESAGMTDGRHPLPTAEIITIAEEFNSAFSAREQWLTTGDKLIVDENDSFADGWWYIPDKDLTTVYKLTFDQNEQYHEFLAEVNEKLREIELCYFGIIDREHFYFPLYAEIIEHFSLTATDWTNSGRTYDRELIKLYR
jgi:hypothetical protein